MIVIIWDIFFLFPFWGSLNNCIPTTYSSDVPATPLLPWHVACPTYHNI